VSIIHVPSNAPFITIPHIDKIVHLLMYFSLATIIYWDSRKLNLSLQKLIWLAFLLPSLYGGLIEILQENFFPPRTGSWGDFSADCIGALLGFIILRFLLSRVKIFNF
jgi:VanZ family protein